MRDELYIEDGYCTICGQLLPLNTYEDDVGICSNCLEDIDEGFIDFNNIDNALEDKRHKGGFTY